MKRQKLKFVFVGAFNTALSILIFDLCYALLGTDVHYLYILVLSHFISVLFSYVNFRVLVFRPENSFWTGFINAHIAYLLTLVLQTALLYLAVHFMKTPVMVAQGVVAVLVACATYLLHANFTFKKRYST